MVSATDVFQCLKYLNIVVFIYLFSKLSADDADHITEVLLCRQCGHEVTAADNLINTPSVKAVRMRNSTILGKSHVLVQLFENPQGNQYELITTTKADVFKLDKSYSDHSWFPGFLWRVIVCPRCGLHLGWHFESELRSHEGHGKSFVGLILHNLLHRDFADSLLITPKSYYS